MPELKLNLGAGADRLPGFVNVDAIAADGVDQVVNLDKFPWPWADGSVDRIRAFDVLEHVWDPDRFIRECWRVLRPGGILDIHTCGVDVNAQGQVRISPNYFVDADHKQPFTLRSFDYFVANGNYLHARYGMAKTAGYAVFEYAPGGEPRFVDGLELAVLLRKPMVS